MTAYTLMYVSHHWGCDQCHGHVCFDV